MQIRGWTSLFCRNFFCLRVPKNISRWTLLCFKKFLVLNFFMQKMGGGIAVLSNFYCLWVPVLEKFGNREVLCLGRRYYYSPLKSFCLKVPEEFVGEHFCVSKKISSRKLSCKRGGTSWFCEFFCLRGLKRFLGGYFSVSEKFGYRKIFCLRSGHYFLTTKFFGITDPKNIRRWTLLCFKKFLVLKFFMQRMGGGFAVLSNF